MNSSINYMMNFVKEYLDGKMERMGFDLDFNYYLIEHYPRMEYENSDIAECFYFYLSQEGFDHAENLADHEHKKLILKQWNEFNAVTKNGLF